MDVAQGTHRRPTSEEPMTDEKTGLKACPFCGGEALLTPGYPCSLVICQVCRCRSLGKDGAAAIAAWNTRATPPNEEGR